MNYTQMKPEKWPSKKMRGQIHLHLQTEWIFFELYHQNLIDLEKVSTLLMKEGTFLITRCYIADMALGIDMILKEP